jgi:hypothetical protein
VVPSIVGAETPVITDKPCRFTPPWDIEGNGACFIVRDHSRRALSYVCYENDPGRRTAANFVTRDETKLPDLIRR